MSSNRYILHALKYSIVTMLVLGGAMGISGVLEKTGVNLQGRLVAPQQQGVVPTQNFTASRFADGGFNVPPDTHVIFSIPQGVTIPIVTATGGPDINNAVLFWMYCYSGNEAKNKAAGKRGAQMYDGRFYYSNAQLVAMKRPIQAGDNDLLALREKAEKQTMDLRGSQKAYLQSGDTCYLQVDGETSRKIGEGVYMSPDTDEDDVPDLREQHFGTDPTRGDTDEDGLSDGQEIFITKTDPLQYDTDLDGLSDECEIRGATDPRRSDTDSDGLCDGRGGAQKCPEARRWQCSLDVGPTGDRACGYVVTSPVQGEDMNENCVWDQNETDPRRAETFESMTDFQYKLNQLRN